MPLSCAGRSCPGRTAGRTSTGGSTCTTPSARWSLCSAAGGRKRSTPCGSCSMRGWWKSRNRAVENPTAFTRNPMKRFQTPTSRNPVMVRRRAENRTWRVRKSILLKYGNLTVYRNTEIKTIYLHSFHSNPIRDIFGGKTRRKGMEWGKEFNGTTCNFAI